MDYKSQALLYYNDAIQHLTANSNHVPAEVYLVCGLLFAATEYWPHRHMAPTFHILTAFRLILRSTAMLPEAVKEGMYPFLVHMGRKTLAFADDVPDDLAAQMRTLVWLTIPPPEVPISFRSVNEAWSYMDDLVNFVGSFSYDDLKFTIQGRSKALNYASALLDALLHTSSLLHPQDQHNQTQYRVLLMHHRTLQVMLDAALVGPGDETIYDLFTADFEHILYECECLLAPEHQQATQLAMSAPSNSSPCPSPTTHKSQPWRTSLGVLPPLFFVATRCRVPSLRHRAIKALHASRRREREWNSCIATMLARFVVRTETQHACAAAAASGAVNGGMLATANGTIGEEHRICLESVEFDREEQVIRVEYVHPRTGETGTGTLEWRIEAAGGIDDEFECVMMPGKRLRMSGYCGIMLVTPPISCQCGGDQMMVQQGAEG